MRAFRIAYDGRPYNGFQRQPDVPTVEDDLFDALRALDICEDEPAAYSAAGRTDAGVSALAQTLAFEAPAWLSPSAINGELPDSIRAWASADVPAFHATHDATRREYTYHLYAPDLDDDRIREAARRLSGVHDFHNLTPDDRLTEREIDIDIDRDGEFVVLVFTSEGFSRQLVRRLVSLLRNVGSGSPLERVDRVLSAAVLDGPQGVPPAPPYPLVLTDVGYEFDFVVDADAAAHARSVFDAARIEHATLVRVVGSIVDGIDE